MAVYTPRGLKVRLPVSYAFALIARVYPRSDAFRVLQLTEAVENLGGLATFLAGLVAFSLRLEPLQIGIVVFVAVSIARVVHLLGLFVPPFTLLVPVSRMYGFVSGFGILLVGLLILGVVTVGWAGVVGFAIGRLASGLVFVVAEMIHGKRIHRKTGIAISASERSFFHAFRLEASRLGASTDLTVSDGELARTNWEPVLQDLSAKWPEVVSRFTGDDA